MNFGVCNFSSFEVTDWRLRRWRLWFLALMTATLVSVHRRAEQSESGQQEVSGIKLDENRVGFKFLASLSLRSASLSLRSASRQVGQKG